jgi:Fe-S oxidoreductase
MAAHLPRQPMRSLLGVEDEHYVAILRDPGKVNDESGAVFYFPGCGSERLFSQIGLASLAMLYELGVETVLAPGYLCCGYPQGAGGDKVKATRIATANQVLFHRVANTLNYLDIKTVLVSCGTCLDQLLTYQLQQIFPGARLLDIHEYLAEKGVALEGVDGVRYLYHDPCHSPMKTQSPVAVAAKLVGQPVLLSERCCGEAGTFAISRPDIATQVRFRKQEEIERGIARLEATYGNAGAGAAGAAGGTGRSGGTGGHGGAIASGPVGASAAARAGRAVGIPGAPGQVKVLTSCPACLQGLSRYRDEVAIEPEYIVTEVACHRLGEDWQARFLERVKNGGIERVLL